MATLTGILSKRGIRTAGLALAATAVLTAGCATEHLEEFNEIEMGHAAPLEAESPGEPDEGEVVDVGGDVSAVTSLGGGSVAVTLSDPPRVLFGEVSADGTWTESASADLPAGLPEEPAQPGRGPDGGLTVPVTDGVALVDDSGSVTEVDGLGEVTAAMQLDDGRILTGDGAGVVTVREADGTEDHELTGLESVDQFVIGDGDILAVSRADTTVAYIDPDGDFADPILRAGKGVGLADADESGYAVASDATGQALLVFRIEPLRMHQMFPIEGAPWGTAIDSGEGLLWSTTTGDNRLLGYDLGSGTGVLRADVPTVTQPESVAVTGDGVVVVGSATGDGLHVVTPELDPA